MKKIIMLGSPGSGKGTQSALIQEAYGIPAISTGDIFRKNIEDGTELGKKAKAYMDKGELVPDDLVIQIAIDRIEQKDCANGFLLDGFPRTVYQAEALDKHFADNGQTLTKVILISVPDDELMRRLAGRRVCRTCGKSYHIHTMPPEKEGVCGVCGGELYQRSDDSEATAKNRIDVYNQQTMPLVEYYNEENLLVKIDGMQSPEAVFSDIAKALGDPE